MSLVYYIGLAVHKDSIAIAYTNSESRAEVIFYRTCGGITTAERKLRKKIGNHLTSKESLRAVGIVTPDGCSSSVPNTFVNLLM